MSRPVRRGAFKRTCRRCGWTGTYDTAAKGNYAKRRHSCERTLALAAKAERGRARTAAVDRTPKPCHHPVANHQHGTYACYTLDACRCEPCAIAVRDYERARKRQQAYGRWDNLVDAEPARQHVRALMAQGMGLKRIAATGAISQGSLWKLLYGKNGSPVSKRITKSVAQRVLALELDLADGQIVDGGDTARRLQALVANGWSMSKLALRLGWSPGNLNPSIRGERQVTVALAKAVQQLYVELADQAPPEQHHRDKIAASRARRHAAERGWAPPLRIAGRLVVGTALPSPREVDEPVEISVFDAFDEAAIIRRMNGDRTVPLTKPDRIELVRRAREAGWSYLDIERRAGIGKTERYLTRDEQEAS